MQLSNIKHNEGYLDCVKDLMATEEVESMRRWRHHIMITTYEHSVFVSYIAFRLARRWNCDCRLPRWCGCISLGEVSPALELFAFEKGKMRGGGTAPPGRK